MSSPIPDPNRQDLLFIAHELGDAVDQMVFIGGVVAGILITDPAAPLIRPTKGIDCIIEIKSRVEYDTRVRNILLGKGFKELTDDGFPICAWHKRGVRLDVLPTDGNILGFTNRWYRGAIGSSKRMNIERSCTPPAAAAPKDPATPVVPAAMA